MKNIKLVITDLDNTLYDWFEPWYKAYSGFVEEVLKNTNIKEANLLEEIKKIHQLHGTSEYSFDFMLDELKIFQESYPKEKIDQLKHKFYKIKKKYLKLYPGVMETLCLLKDKGCILVVYTESMGFYANDRIRKLGLDGIIDKIYSPEKHSIPETYEPYYPEDYYKLKKTKHIFLPLKHKKPNSDILEQIIKQFNFKKDEILYIGDSLTKDIKMAKDIGIIDVYAEYGLSYNEKEYELLKKVTHWTSEEIEKEKNTTKNYMKPSYTLKASFSEILNEFKFDKIDDKELENLIKIWDRTIDVQKHFNDIELRIVQLAITVSSLLLGGMFAIFKLNGIATKLISIGFFIAAFIWLIFYFVDRFWYHPLLKGSVYAGLKLEEKISLKLDIEGLTGIIGEKSPIKNKLKINYFKKIFFLNVFSKEEFHSEDKMDIFYSLIVIILFITGFLFFILGY